MAYMRDVVGRRLDSFPVADATSPGVVSANRAVLLGDSFAEQAGGPRKSAGLAPWDAKGVIVWANYFLGQAFRIVQNVGVGGQQMHDFLARVPADVDAYDPAWVLGTGGVNDVSAGRTAAQIITDFTALFNALIVDRGYRVSWNTITTATGWSTDKFKVQAAVNLWLTQVAPSIWPNLVVCDVFAALYSVSAGLIPSAYRTDATHLNAAGAIRAGKAMADALRPYAPVGFLGLEVATGSATPNLLTNGRFSNPSSNVGAGWAASGGSVTHSQEPRTDMDGVWQRAVITANSWSTYAIGGQALDLDKITPGVDKARFAVECRVSGLDLATPTAKTQRFNARMQFYDASNALLSDTSGAFADGNYDNILYQPGRGVLMTPDTPVPASATKVTISLTMIGTGTFEWDRATLTRVTD